MTTQPLIINNFEEAIGDSPHKGFGLMSRVDIESFTGAVKSGTQLTSSFHLSLSTTFTADAATDICTSAKDIESYNIITGTAVTLTTTGTLPAGLATATNYFIIHVSSTTFKLATTLANADAGTAIDITDAGLGTHTFATVDPSTITHIITNPRTANDFALDSDGKVWYGNTGGRLLLLVGYSTTNTVGNGIVYFENSGALKQFLFIFRNAYVDIVDITSTNSPIWTIGWQVLNSGAGSGNRHHAILAQDNIVYFTDDKYIGSIKENSGYVFDPANSATYTYNNKALDTPQGEKLNHLEELGKYILAAGNTWNKIYPWDRLSDSFNLPLNVPEIGVKRLKNIGEIVYILAGTRGNVYKTQGSYVIHFKKIPDQVINNGTTLPSISWGGISSLNGSLLFGMSVQTSGNSGSYLLYPDGRLIIDQIPTTGSTNITAFNNSASVIGYLGGADYKDSSRYGNYESVVHSALYRVASKIKKATYSSLEVVLAKSTATGSYIRIGYRTDTSNAFTTIDSFSTDGSTIIFINDSIGLIDIENIQIQAELGGDVELVEIRLLP